MSKNMLGDALREYTGLRHQLDENLISENGPEWSEQLKRFLRKETCWANGQDKQSPVAEPPVPELLLEPIGTVIVLATTEKFVAREKFILDTGLKAKVKISYLGDKFKGWFGEKVEDPIGEQTLRYGKLRKASVDAPIIAELGGEEKSETTLSETYHLMAKQPNGEKGVLLNNGRANLFYIKDQNGTLRTVFVFWDGVGWYVHALSVLDPDTWHDGRQVFSRNSVLKSLETLVTAQA